MNPMSFQQASIVACVAVLLSPAMGCAHETVRPQHAMVRLCASPPSKPERVRFAAGVFLGSGLVFTSYEAVEGSPLVQVTFQSGRASRARMLAGSRWSGTALLEMEEPACGEPALSTAEQMPKAGEPITLIGPRGVQKGAVVRVEPLADNHARARVYTNIDFKLAYVGGPVINERGELVAIITGRSETGSVAMSVTALSPSKEHLKELWAR